MIIEHLFQHPVGVAAVFRGHYPAHVKILDGKMIGAKTKGTPHTGKISPFQGPAEVIGSGHIPFDRGQGRTDQAGGIIALGGEQGRGAAIFFCKGGHKPFICGRMKVNAPLG